MTVIRVTDVKSPIDFYFDFSSPYGYQQAIAAGVFGSRFTIVDGEPFWGMDRLDQVDRWPATGGW